MSEAGIIILPSSHDGHEGDLEDSLHKDEPRLSTSEWVEKSAHSDLLEKEESWFDEPPEGFSLTVSSISF